MFCWVSSIYKWLSECIIIIFIFFIHPIRVISCNITFCVFVCMSSFQTLLFHFPHRKILIWHFHDYFSQKVSQNYSLSVLFRFLHSQAAARLILFQMLIIRCTIHHYHLNSDYLMLVYSIQFSMLRSTLECLSRISLQAKLSQKYIPDLITLFLNQKLNWTNYSFK